MVEALTFDSQLESLMAKASGVVAMGGYNTFCEILSFDKKALIVPRMVPRLEQFIRASRAQELGLVSMLPDDGIRDAHAMATALRQLPQQQAAQRRGHSRPARWAGKRQPAGRTPPVGTAPPGPPPPVPPAGLILSICVVLKGWPRLSETFIAQELVGLEQRGLTLNLFSLRHPTDRATHALHAQLKAPVTYLPEYLHDEPARVARALKTARRLPGWNHARKVWLKDLARDRTRNRVRRFGQAMVLASELPPDTDWIYSHFLHTPSSVARYAALLTGLPWSFSAHAKDIWTIPEWEKTMRFFSVAYLVPLRIARIRACDKRDLNLAASLKNTTTLPSAFA